jgi:hypothetical protein
VTPAILFYVVLPFALYNFFQYVGFDYLKLEPMSPGLVLYQVGLCLMPLLLIHSQNQKLVQTISALAVTTVISGAVLPEVPPPRSLGIAEWLTVNTIGRFAKGTLESCFLAAIFFITHLFGVNWLYGIVCVAGMLGIGKNVSLRLQSEKLPQSATPSLWRMICIYGLAFSWVAELVQRANLNQDNWQKEWTDVAYGLAAGALLQRLPFLRRFGISGKLGE